MRNGAVAGTLFMTSGNGWINQELYLKWVFVASIPPIYTYSALFTVPHVTYIAALGYTNRWDMLKLVEGI